LIQDEKIEQGKRGIKNRDIMKRFYKLKELAE